MLQQFLQARDLQKLLPPLRCSTVSILLTVFPMLSKTCLHLLKICYASFRSKLISIGLLPIDKTFDTVNFFYHLRCSPSPWCFILAIQCLRKFNITCFHVLVNVFMYFVIISQHIKTYLSTCFYVFIHIFMYYLDKEKAFN